MNIILLSGGSGKRLWPLSNDVRSKQFIKLFKNNDKYESMVQRVYRQVTTVDADAKITIATSKSQASAIKNQLGEKASICVEPCRRDTFPAIALVAAYLHDELSVAENEAVVVCPVDPYVDNTYYEAVKNLQELAEQGGANLTLMGIEPTYPSEKYGYIIPESGENVSKVKEFKEKPDVENAKKYLAQSALWNAGIFAFKLGYLLDKAHSMIDFEDYRDLFNKYDTLTKISFDYAVVEKESSIQVLRYSGDWKDVGTWNMMAEVMADKTKGKAILDETCENTNVVNELNIPILCMGCKDMIVAASGDGILIADKERSGYMKPYVEKIETEAMYAEKSWGTYTVIDVQPGSMTVKVMKEFNPDIVVFHYPNPFVATLLLRELKNSKAKLMVYWHLDIVRQKYLKLLFAPQNRSLLTRADKVIATSPNYIEGSKWLQSVKEKCIVVPNCINVERMTITSDIEKRAAEIREENKDKTICVAVGRHTEYKGFTYLVQASKLLNDKFRIFITGKGELTEKLHEEAKGDAKITFTGRIDDVELKALILASDIFCFPSITKNEAFGLALAEGMYYKKPSVTFNIPGSGVNYVSLNKVTGIEVENRNVEKYADAMRTLAQNKELSLKYGKAGKERVENNFLSTQFCSNIKKLFATF